MNRLMIAAFGFCLCVLPYVAAADGFDGSSPLICTSIEAHECEPGAECLAGTPEYIDIPRFIRLDFENSVVLARRLEGEERTSRIKSVTLDGGELILQGIQLGLGWSMATTQADGRMSLTAAGDGMAFIIFGFCTPL